MRFFLPLVEITQNITVLALELLSINIIETSYGMAIAGLDKLNAVLADKPSVNKKVKAKLRYVTKKYLENRCWANATVSVRRIRTPPSCG